MGTLLGRKKAKPDCLVVGLGNPGSKYRNTRHNAGYLAVDEFLNKHGQDKQSQDKQSQDKQSQDPAPKKNAKNAKDGGAKNRKAVLRGQVEVSEINVGSHYVIVSKPLTFMNLSGRAVRHLSRKYKTDTSRFIIVYDEMDLMPGKVKVKYGGGAAGHRGVASVQNSLGSTDFWRVRIGIGKPPSKEYGAAYVLEEIREPEIREGIAKSVELLEDLIGKF